MRTTSLSIAVLLMVGCGPNPVVEQTPVMCGDDTALQGSTCISVLTCGNGASRSGNQCVATPVDVACAAGTQLQGKFCVADVTCGSGTTVQNGQCVGTGGGSVTCGAGTTLQSGQCIANGQTVSCGTGTMLVGNQCVSSTAQVTCGSGTSLASNTCNVDFGLVCGTNTTKSGSQCVGSSSGSTTCGPGTALSGSQCIPSPATGPVSTFLQTANLSVAAYTPDSAVSYERRLVISELTQGNADAWVNTGAHMIGTGKALHFSSYGYWELPTSGATYVTIEDSAPSGTCTSTADPDVNSTSYTGVRVGFFSWTGGNPSRVSCARQGTVKLERALNGTVMQTKATVNAAFTDGTQLTDKVLWF